MSDSRWEHDRDRLFAALESGTQLKRRAAATPTAGVSVAAGLQIEDSEVGQVTGVRGGAAPAGGVDVLEGATLKRTKIGDITGVEIAPPAPGGAKHD